MSVMSSGPRPVARWHKPFAYRSTLGAPYKTRLPRLRIMKHYGFVTGIGYTWRKQGVLMVRVVR